MEYQKRLDACKWWFIDMPEYMVIPDMDSWKKLKEEIIIKQALLLPEVYDYDYYYEEIDKEERRYLRFKDRLESRRFK